MSWIEASLRWYGVLTGTTWAFAPFVSWLCRALPDRGVAILRPIALLAAVYPAWLIASLGVATFDPRTVIASVVVGGVIGWILIRRSDGANRAWLGSLCVVEAASLALFLAYVWLRGYTPQILGTEKPMDVAFLASSGRATSVPPADPWFAGQPINYYYLGYLLHGTVGRLAGVGPEIGFNLALATIFSISAVAAFGVTWNVVRPRYGPSVSFSCASFAAFAIMLAGNLYAPQRLFQSPLRTIEAWWWDGAVGIGWRSSRIVCDGPRVGNFCQFPSVETINEFPFFSFLLGDLHPHLMALPFTIVAIGLSWHLANLGDAVAPWTKSALLPRIVVSGAIVGALYAINAWDFPTSMLILAFGLVVGQRGSLLRGWKWIVLLGLSAVLPWLPFFISYKTPAGQVALGDLGWLERLPFLSRIFSVVAPHAGERTSAVEYLTVFGIPYAFGLALIALGLSELDQYARGERLKMLALISFATIVPSVALSAPVLTLCGIPLALAVLELKSEFAPTPRVFALGIFSLVWLISIIVELAYVRDVFDNRMNTLFKFYYQAWTLYALGSAVTISLLWNAAKDRLLSRTALISTVGVSVLLGLTYPAIASFQWTGHFSNWSGLDGLAYARNSDPDDAAAIRWLSANSGAGDVVLEAAGCSYRPFDRLPFNRVSAFTGIPTIIGWAGHEQQWRAGDPKQTAEISRRQQDVATMFANPRSLLLEQFGVKWLFVGSYERDNWRSECAVAGPYPASLANGYPGPGWREAFKSGQTRIYRKIET